MGGPGGPPGHRKTNKKLNNFSKDFSSTLASILGGLGKPSWLPNPFKIAPNFDELLDKVFQSMLEVIWEPKSMKNRCKNGANNMLEAFLKQK